MQLRKGISRQLVTALDRALTDRGVSRASVCRAARVDPSTIWRAIKGRGRARETTLAAFGEVMLGMVARTGPEPDLGTTFLEKTLRDAALWIADQRANAESGEALAVDLTLMAGQQEFRRRFGAAGQAFVELFNLKAAGAVLTAPQTAALAALGLLMIAEVGLA